MMMMMINLSERVMMHNQIQQQRVYSAEAAASGDTHTHTYIHIHTSGTARRGWIFQNVRLGSRDKV